MTLEQDQTAVLKLVLSTFVGPVATRREIERVIRRAAEEALERSEQLTAERARISPALRDAILADSQAIDPAVGF